MTELVFLIAPPRSGTNALRAALAKGSNCKNIGEIFHGDSGAVKYSYFYWRLGLIKNNTELSIPTQENIDYLWRNYIDSIIENTEISIIDVKYNSLRCLDHLWQAPLSRPYFLQKIMKNNSKIIVLWRRNVERMVLSLLVAMQTGKWVYSNNKKVDYDITIDPKLYKNTYYNIASTKIELENWINKYNNAIFMEYEDLFDRNGILTKESIGSLSKFLNQDIKQVKYRIKRTPIDYTKSIKNYDIIGEISKEISNTLRDTVHDAT